MNPPISRQLDSIMFFFLFLVIAEALVRTSIRDHAQEIGRVSTFKAGPHVFKNRVRTFPLTHAYLLDLVLNRILPVKVNI